MASQKRSKRIEGSSDKVRMQLEKEPWRSSPGKQSEFAVSRVSNSSELAEVINDPWLDQLLNDEDEIDIQNNTRRQIETEDSDGSTLDWVGDFGSAHTKGVTIVS